MPKFELTIAKDEKNLVFGAVNHYQYNERLKGWLFDRMLGNDFDQELCEAIIKYAFPMPQRLLSLKIVFDDDVTLMFHQIEEEK